MKARNFALLFFLIGLVVMSFNQIFRSVGFSVSNDSSIGYSFYLFGALMMFIGGFLIAVMRNSDFTYTSHVNESYIQKRGWTQDMIKKTLADADASSLKLTRATKTPYGLAVVYTLQNDPDNFVVRGIDGSLLQVSDRNKEFKTPNFRSDYIYMGNVTERKRKMSGKVGHKKK